MRILLIDDDEWIREGWKRVFEGEGWKVTTAESENEAEDVIRKEPPFDVAVMDMSLSPEDIKGKGGLRMIRLINEKNGSTQVIAVTAMGAEEITENIYKAMRFGIYQYMSKIMPDLLEKLIEEIKSTRTYTEERDRDLEQGLRQLIKDSEGLMSKPLVTQRELESALEKKGGTGRTLYGILIERGVKEDRIKWVLNWYKRISVLPI